MKLFENDWLAINHLLLKMYSQKENHLLENDAMQNLKYLIPYDKATFWRRNYNAGSLLCEPESIHFPMEDLKSRRITLESELPQVWVHFYEKCIVLRDSDFKDELTPSGSLYYLDLLTKHNIKFALTISLCQDNMPIGVLTLFREKDGVDFSDKEIYIAEQLAEHIACYCYNIYEIEKLKETDASSVNLPDIIAKYQLSAREVEVLQCLLEGKNASTICETLCITESTQKKHLSNIYKKMHIKNRTELFKILFS